jgi:hypothetical protein
VRTIHKFYVPAYPGIHEIEVPGFVRWIDAAAQGEMLVMWARVLIGFNTSRRCEVAVAWTGQPMPDTDAPHFRSVQASNGLVHHIFADPEPTND